MRWALITICLIALFPMTGCGGSAESQSENQLLEEHAFKAHSAYLLAEAEVLAYRVRTTTSRRYARHETYLAEHLLRECQEAITEAECSVSERLGQILHEMKTGTQRR